MAQKLQKIFLQNAARNMHKIEITLMNNQKDEHQKFDKSEKPQYIKPKVVATYRSPELEKEFANVYGTSVGEDLLISIIKWIW